MPEPPTPTPLPPGAGTALTPLPSATPKGTPDAALPAGARFVKVVDANQPVGLAFAPDGRMFYLERDTGNVRAVSGGRVFAEPLAHLEAAPGGMWGLALDPKFPSPRVLWVYYTTAAKPAALEAARLTLEGNHAVDTQVVFSLPEPSALDRAGPVERGGGALRFGPDGMLYLAVGDHGSPAAAQDLRSAMGKVHRFAPVTPLAPAARNPYSNSSVYAYGLRQSQGLDFDPLTGRLFASVNGWTCDDLLVHVPAASNLGWRPGYTCGEVNREPTAPLLTLRRQEKPAGLAGLVFYRGEQFPEWKNDLWLCGTVDGRLRRVRLNSERSAVMAVDLYTPPAPCSLAVENGPDGALYFTSAQGIYRLGR